MKEKTQLVFRYHERTKHRPHRYARSPGFLDWANEPDPFRRYEGAALLSLPFSEEDPGGDYHDLYERDNNPFQSFSLKNISILLELSLGLSAWKSYGGSRWALRMNPSSGNLHPTEAHLILPPLPENDDRGGVYHYSPFFHALEPRAAFDARFWLQIRDHFSAEGFFIGLSSIYWRESWKYGERAFRYCNHDVGHAMAALSFAANLLGWKITYLNALSDRDVGVLLGFHKTDWMRFEAENPELLLFVHANSEIAIPMDIPPEIVDSFQSLSYSGEPNRLSIDHRDWEVIDEVSSASEKPRTPAVRYRYGQHPFFGKESPPKQAAAIIRRRRSALAFDAETALPEEYFFGMLDRTVPRDNAAPFDLGVGETSVHLLIFVHRVSGLEPGLYFLVRDERALGEIKRRCRPDFLWKNIDAASGSLDLYLLKRGDFRSEGAAAG
jgi:SagB-type dehydrogenase family enzyme